MAIDYVNLDIRTLPEFEYQYLFVRLEREAMRTTVNVLLDGNHLAYFQSAATTEEAFIQDCEKYLKSEQYENAYNNRYEGAY